MDAVVQALILRPVLTPDQLRSLRDTCTLRRRDLISPEDEKELKPFVALVNKALSVARMELRRHTHEYDGSCHYGIANLSTDDLHSCRGATNLNDGQVGFMHRILTEICGANDNGDDDEEDQGKTGGKRKRNNGKDASGSEGEEDESSDSMGRRGRSQKAKGKMPARGGRRKAVLRGHGKGVNVLGVITLSDAIALRNSPTAEHRSLPQMEADDLIVRWIKQGYLETDRADERLLTLGPRGHLDLSEVIAQTLKAVRDHPECTVCHEMVLRGASCPNAKCAKVMHDRCAREWFSNRPSEEHTCMSCSSEWRTADEWITGRRDK